MARQRKCRICRGKFNWDEVSIYGLCRDCERDAATSIDAFLRAFPERTRKKMKMWDEG